MPHMICSDQSHIRNTFTYVGSVVFDRGYLPDNRYRPYYEIISLVRLNFIDIFRIQKIYIKLSIEISDFQISVLRECLKFDKTMTRRR